MLQKILDAFYRIEVLSAGCLGPDFAGCRCYKFGSKKQNGKETNLHSSTCYVKKTKVKGEK